MRPQPSVVRLVALDLDGTVVGRDLSVHQRVRDAIAGAHTAGIMTTIVTGRMYRSAKPFIDMLGITVPVVCFQGAGIYDAVSGAVLHEEPVAPELVQRVLVYAKERDLHIQLYAEGTYFVEERTEYGAIYAYVSGVEPEVVRSLQERFVQEPSTKVVIVTDAQQAGLLAEELAQFCGSEAYVTRSNPEFVEVIAPKIDKGRALEVVARHLGVPMAQTIAVGDSWNDIPLLKASAFGVAMGNAPAEVQALADAVVASVEHDGVAEAYERFIMPAAIGLAS